MLIRMLTLKLLHHSYPCIMNKLEADTAKHKLKKIITQALPAEQGGALAAEEKVTVFSSSLIFVSKLWGLEVFSYLL